jgi:hypothetical protein
MFEQMSFSRKIWQYWKISNLWVKAYSLSVVGMVLAMLCFIFFQWGAFVVMAAMVAETQLHYLSKHLHWQDYEFSTGYETIGVRFCEEYGDKFSEEEQRWIQLLPFDFFTPYYSVEERNHILKLKNVDFWDCKFFSRFSMRAPEFGHYYQKFFLNFVRGVALVSCLAILSIFADKFLGQWLRHSVLFYQGDFYIMEEFFGFILLIFALSTVRNPRYYKTRGIRHLNFSMKNEYSFYFPSWEKRLACLEDLYRSKAILRDEGMRADFERYAQRKVDLHSKLAAFYKTIEQKIADISPTQQQIWDYTRADYRFLRGLASAEEIAEREAQRKALEEKISDIRDNIEEVGRRRTREEWEAYEREKR